MSENVADDALNAGTPGGVSVGEEAEKAERVERPSVSREEFDGVQSTLAAIMAKLDSLTSQVPQVESLVAEVEPTPVSVPWTHRRIG